METENLIFYKKICERVGSNGIASETRHMLGNKEVGNIWISDSLEDSLEVVESRTGVGKIVLVHVPEAVPEQFVEGVRVGANFVNHTEAYTPEEREKIYDYFRKEALERGKGTSQL